MIFVIYLAQPQHVSFLITPLTEPTENKANFVKRVCAVRVVVLHNYYSPATDNVRRKLLDDPHTFHCDDYCVCSYKVLRAWRHGMAWNGMDDVMEWNGNFGMEYGRCQNGMETIFHTSIPISYQISLMAFTEKYVWIVVIKNM